MSTWKITKGIMLAQFIWVAIVGTVVMLIALFATNDSTKKTKRTKNGFQTQKMEDLYQHYKQKAKA